MSDFTPGPWESSFAADKRGRVAIYGPPTAYAPHPRIAILEDQPTRLTARANAHLIASAPDLLAALQELIELADDGAFIDLADVGSTPISRRIRAAIAKALGEVPRGL